MLDINKTLLYTSMIFVFYVGYKVGRKVEHVKGELFA